MVSSYTTRNRLLKQGTGDSTNLWGDLQSSGDFDLIDFMADGWTTKTLTADYSLTTANAAADEARARCLKFNGTGSYTVTIPSLEKAYFVWNNLSGTLTITTGGGTTSALSAGERVFVICDGSNVNRIRLLTMGGDVLTNLGAPTANSDAATKLYVDDTAFATMSGSFPGMTGNAGKVLTNDGSSTASWTDVSPTLWRFGGSTVTDVAITKSASAKLGVRTGDDTAFADLEVATLYFSAGGSVSDVVAAADVRTGTSTTHVMTPGGEYNGLAFVTLTDAATIAVDMGTFINATVTLAGNRTLANPTNAKAGQSGTIEIVQDATGSRTLTFSSAWKREGGAPTLSTSAGAKDYICYTVISSSLVIYGIIRSPS